MISIKSTEMRNFLGYGDYVTILNFSDYPGSTLIVGEKDGEPDKHCATGKTSLMEAIVWCLFGGITILPKPGDKIVNWNVGHSCYVKIETVDGYTILRTRKLNGNDELIVQKDGMDITKSTKLPMQEFINSTFKIDFETFVASVVYGQGSKSFLEASETARRKVIEKLFKIGNLNGRASVAVDKIKMISKDIMVLDDKLKKVDNDILMVDRYIADSKTSEQSFTSEKVNKTAKVKLWLLSQKEQTDTKISSINAQIAADTERLSRQPLIDIRIVNDEWASFNTMIGPIDDKIKAYDNSLRESDININVLKSAVVSMTDKLSQMTNAKTNSVVYPSVDDVTKMWKMYETKMAVIDDSKSVIAGIANKMSGETALLKDKKAKLDSFRNVSAQCSECDQVVTSEYRSVTDKKYILEIHDIETKIAEYSNSIASMNVKINDVVKTAQKPQYSIDFVAAKINDSLIIDRTIAELSNKLHDAKTELISQSAKFEANKVLLDKIKVLRQSKIPKMTVAEATSINNVAVEINKMISFNNDKISDLKQQLKDCVVKAAADIKQVDEESNPYTALVANNEESKNKLIAERIVIDNDRTIKLMTLKHLEYIKDAYNNKRKIKAWWISKLIPYLNDRIKYYLNHFQIQDKIEFDEFLSIKVSRWDYILHSGGEKKSIDLSIMFGLRDLHTSVFGQQSSVLLLDEVDGKLDEFFINKLVSLLNDDILARNDGLTNVLIISHKSEMYDKFPNKIRVKNKGGNAYIVNE